MTKADTAVEDLERLAHELQERGEEAMAKRVVWAVTVLHGDRRRPELMTTGEAAQALEIRSVNTIKRWVSDGLLEGFRRGGRVLVTRASVEAIKNHSALGTQVAFERTLNEALSPFDIGDEPTLEVSAAWVGRRPWEQDSGRPAKPTPD